MIWKCPCGEINLGVSKTCRVCGTPFSDEFIQSNTDRITKPENHDKSEQSLKSDGKATDKQQAAVECNWYWLLAAHFFTVIFLIIGWLLFNEIGIIPGFLALLAYNKSGVLQAVINMKSGRFFRIFLICLLFILIFFPICTVVVILLSLGCPSTSTSSSNYGALIFVTAWFCSIIFTKMVFTKLKCNRFFSGSVLESFFYTLTILIFSLFFLVLLIR